ncbi:hypothetical protein [Methylocystis bryophila]|uniref:Uncharacterized protein n=1 Tax=Methylocystis bryophila TaxID=655015 RepID=A0A1W6MX10_9HYPH|nr:hypothetical protein [Methylocystis bryophila]ARN82113.1 hypothetical protein B1812_14660 [Methylocystis bryophila]BDV38243.1 hypothetical protein DSM21852_14960 [Methylocystis bryophila]
MWFLLKSLLVLAVIFFLASRESQPEGQVATKAKVEPGRRATPAREADVIETLKRAAAEKLAEGVKERCLKRPEDCLSVARTVGSGLSALDKTR